MSEVSSVFPKFARFVAITGALSGAVVLTAAPAHAQRATGVTLSLSGLPANAVVNGTKSEVELNIETCVDAAAVLSDPIRFAWTVTSPGTDRRYAIKINSGSSGCTQSVGGGDEAECDVIASEETLAATITRDIDLGDILRGIADADACYDTATTSRYEVHLYLEDANDDDTPANDLTVFLLDLRRPAAPEVAPTLSAGETTVGVAWDEADDLDYRVFYSSTPGALEGVALPEELPSGIESKGASGGSVDLTGLETDVTYYVAVAAEEESGNLSLLGPVASITTAPTTDFFELYKAAGGAEAGGCAVARPAASGDPLWLLGLAVLLRRRSAR